MCTRRFVNLSGFFAGFTNVNRRGTTDVWYVSGVGVRPGYRGRGIARQLPTASYALDQRITPEHVLPYEPVEESRYRKLPMARLRMPLFMKADGLKTECSIIRTQAAAADAMGLAYNRLWVRCKEIGGYS